MRLSPSHLQAALNSLANANNRAQVAREKVMQHCQSVYGVEPGDVDNDAFIDACDGGSGACMSMTSTEFDSSMRNAMKQMGVSMPENE